VEDPLIEGVFKTREPNPESSFEVDPDVILLPLLAFDEGCARIGYGKGHYDKLIQRLKVVEGKNVLTIGVSFEIQKCF
jgi:5-formyltetrahydrofolate cyclo-ligase